MMPFYFMFLSSPKSGMEILRLGLSFKVEPDLMSFTSHTALHTYREGIYSDWYKSSLTIMLPQTAIGLALSIVGYALTMYNFKGKKASGLIARIVLMMPFVILVLPMYRSLISFKLTNSCFGVIMPYLVPTYRVFFFRQFASGLLKELIKAGRIDGCTDYDGRQRQGLIAHKRRVNHETGKSHSGQGLCHRKNRSEAVWLFP